MKGGGLTCSCEEEMKEFKENRAAARWKYFTSVTQTPDY